MNNDSKDKVKKNAKANPYGGLSIFANNPGVKAVPDMDNAFSVEKELLEKFNAILLKSTFSQVREFWLLLQVMASVGRMDVPLKDFKVLDVKRFADPSILPGMSG